MEELNAQQCASMEWPDLQKNVELAMLETDGNISILTKPLEEHQTRHIPKHRLHQKFKRQ
jgi:uncharacterized membrane protein YcaP (DUF421 family)